MKTKTMKIKLNAQSRIGYYYMGLLSRKRRIKEYGKLWKASIDDYARKEITG